MALSASWLFLQFAIRCLTVSSKHIEGGEAGQVERTDDTYTKWPQRTLGLHNTVQLVPFKFN